jgi:hypothetical protein
MRRDARWGEDGIAGLCDRYGFLNLAVAMWNGQDDRLKERLFGLTNPEGNHGEDAKEYWWHLDATPTHAYAQYLYRYPQRAFPYDELVAHNAERSRDQSEFELSDTGILADDRFFDVVVTHAKAAPTDVVMTVTAMNHGPDPAPLHLVPQLWFRNTWAWGRDDRRVGLFRAGADGRRPSDPRDLLDEPLWTQHPTFSEYFHGDTGIGLGAGHQTGWTAMVAHLICTPPPLGDPVAM